MSNNSKVPSLIRSIMGLFVTRKKNVTFINRKEDYFKKYYFNHKFCDGIELVAGIERITKKNAAELLMKAGLSSWMGGKITEYIKSERAARELNQKLQRYRFVFMLRKYARERGMDISKFI
jgi:hypothetical protein